MESELSLDQDPRESLCMPTALSSWYKAGIPWAHRDWNTRKMAGHGNIFPTGFESWCLVESCFWADQEFWKFCGPSWRWSFLISWSERTHSEIKSHPVLFAFQDFWMRSERRVHCQLWTYQPGCREQSASCGLFTYDAFSRWVQHEGATTNCALMWIT